MATYDFRLGRTIPQLDNVEEPGLFGVPPHPWVFRAGATRYAAGTGHSYYDGYSQAEWTFEYLSIAAWANLIEMFEGAESVSVAIRTKVGADTYGTFAGIMHRPVLGEDAERGVGGWFNIGLKFTHLEEVT